MEIRCCSVCRIGKPLSEFGVHHQSGTRKGDPYRKYCKECQAEKGKEWRADPAHEESLKQTYLNGKKRVKNWKDDRNYDAEWRKRNKNYHREWWLKSSFGMTIEEYDKMLQSQNGKCAICGATYGNGRAKNLAVDHDHATGKIRGLLCIRCNQAIGSFDDSVELLRKAAEYLEH